MKRIQLLAIASIFIASTASAQISKGSVLLGGNIGYSSSKAKGNSDPHSINLNFSPTVGLTVKENLVVGIDAGYSKQRFGTKDNPLSTSKSYGGSVFLRKYFPIGKSFYLFGQSNLGYSSGEIERTNYPSTGYTQIEEQYSIALRAYPGISYAVSRKLHLEAGLNNLLNISYGRAKSSTLHTTTGLYSYSGPTSEFNIGTNLFSATSINVGFRIFLNNK